MNLWNLYVKMSELQKADHDMNAELKVYVPELNAFFNVDKIFYDGKRKHIEISCEQPPTKKEEDW